MESKNVIVKHSCYSFTDEPDSAASLDLKKEIVDIKLVRSGKKYFLLFKLGRRASQPHEEEWIEKRVAVCGLDNLAFFKLERAIQNTKGD